MLYMVIEHFRGGDAVPVYRRFRDQGRLAPEGLHYVASWVTDDVRRCYRLRGVSGDDVRRRRGGDRAPPVSLPPRIATERLLLRCYRPEDAVLLKEAIDANLEHLRRWMPWAMDEPSPLDVLELRLADFASAFDAGEDWAYGIFEPAERTLYGGAGVHRRGAADVLEIGYWVRAELEGRGYVTEAAAALAQAALRVDGVERVEIRCDPRNTRSAAVPARLGFRFVETLIENTLTPTGEPRDTMVWELRQPQS
jgi:RimJ/RimL family protein N-acetyltransferase